MLGMIVLSCCASNELRALCFGSDFNASMPTHDKG